jgi:hypothetical protein
MKTTFDPRTAAVLAERAVAIQGASAELASLGEFDPGLAGECGVEVCSLEARTILAGGAAGRVAQIAAEAAQKGQSAVIATSDLEALSRLEAVTVLGSSRIGLKLAALDAEAAEEPKARIGSLMGLATGAVGLFKTFF